MFNLFPEPSYRFCEICWAYISSLFSIARTSISATARFKFSSIPCGGLFLGRDNHILSNSLKNGKRLKTYSNIIPLFRVSSICVCHKIICIYFLTTLKILVDKFSLRYYTAYRILEKRGGDIRTILRGEEIYK